MAPSASTARDRLRAAALGTALTAALAGCTFVTPVDTNRSMVPGDGLTFDLTPTISVSSLLIVSEAVDEPGVLIARVVNSGSEATSVTISGAGLDEDVDVPPNQTVDIGGVDEGSQRVVIDSVPEEPGKYVPLTFTTGGTSREEVAPVLDGTFPEYQPYLAEIPGS